MQTPLQITFRHMDVPAGANDAIREKVEGLGRAFPRLIGCEVVVDRQHHRHHKGDLFHVRIDVAVPGTTLAVNRVPADDHSHEDVHAAIRDAFDQARRRLDDHARALQA